MDMNTEQKALAINLDASRFGTFAEIGAGHASAPTVTHDAIGNQTAVPKSKFQVN
jgi:hypothetical protein